MGFFDFLFTRKVKTLEKTNLQNLEDSAKKKISEHEENFKQEAKSFFEKIKQQEDNIKTDLGKLSSAKVTEQVDPQLMKVAETSRKSFIKKVEVLIENEEEKFEIEYLLLFQKSFLLKFKEFDSGTVMEFASLKDVFKESYAVVDGIKILKKYFDDFGEKLKKVEVEISPFEEISDKIKIIREESGRLDNYKKDLESIFQKNENLRKENEMLKTNLQKLEEGDDWKEFVQMKKKVGEKEIEKREIISQVVQKFSSVERPLKKLNNLMQEDSEISKKILEKYLASPFDAFLEDYEKKTINASLKQAEKFVQENKIKGEEKSLGKIREMIAQDVFGNLAKEWQKINSEIEELNMKIESSEVSKKRDDMAKTISDRENEMKQSNKEKIEQQIKIIEQNLATQKDELQQLAKDNMSAEIEY